MTTIRSTPFPAAAPPQAAPRPLAPSRLAAIRDNLRLYLVLVCLMAPTLVGMALFTYYPQWGTIKHSFYRWDGQMLEEWVGLRNFIRALTADRIFWQSFGLILILFAANLVKMWPSVFTAVILHRIRSEKWQYRYRVLFVIPMIIPGLVWLLIWKSFYEPQIGPLNKFLNATGLMEVLRWLDVKMPLLADTLAPLRVALADTLAGSVWGLLVAGLVLLSVGTGLRTILRNWMWWLVLLGAASLVWRGQSLYFAFWLLVPLLAAQIMNRRTGESANRRSGEPARRTQTPLAGSPIRRFADSPPLPLRWIGVAFLAIAIFFILASMTWTRPTHAFDTPYPGWLSQTHLVIPAIIFWGFPWVGTIGVLIYLAGLQSISHDVYEAGEIDGVGSLGRFFYIELPLILTQVRINLIFLTIGTLTDFGLFLLLLGPEGGPNSVGMVPGLYMYRQAFIDSEFGYACALGMILFVMILFITLFYQRYLKVEK